MECCLLRTGYFAVSQCKIMVIAISNGHLVFGTVSSAFRALSTFIPHDGTWHRYDPYCPLYPAAEEAEGTRPRFPEAAQPGVLEPGLLPGSLTPYFCPYHGGTAASLGGRGSPLVFISS